jgi:hypothetical protein
MRMTGRTNRGHRVVAVTSLMTVFGCGQNDSRSTAFTNEAGAPVSIETMPLLTLGEADGDTLQTFHQVRQPFLLGGDRVVVPLAGTNVIRVFDLGGSYLASFGRPGPGPGEFTRLDQAWARGDTLEAYDSGTRTITRFLPTGQLESLRLENPDTSSRLTSPFSAVSGTFGEGWVMIAVPFAGFGARDSLRILHFGRDGRSTGVLGEVLGMRRYQSAAGSGPEPLSPRARVALANGVLYTGETLTPRIDVLDASGERRSVAWNPMGTESASRAWQLLRDSLVASAPADRRAAVVEQYRHLQEPEQISTFWDVVPDQAGFVWISPYEPLNHSFSPFAPEASGGEWSVYTSNGEKVAEVSVPAGLQPTFIDERHVVGIHRDELGLETVRVYELTRR